MFKSVIDTAITLVKANTRHKWVNPLMLKGLKQPGNIDKNCAGKCKVGIIFEGEMLFITLTTVLQIFCKIFLNFQVLIKRILDREDNFCQNCI